MKYIPFLFVLVLSACVSAQTVSQPSVQSNQPIQSAPVQASPPQPGHATTQQVSQASLPMQSELEVYFPRAGDQVPDKLIQLWGGARKSLDIAIYSLTYPSIIKAIGDANRSGVKVRILTDETEAKSKSQQAAINGFLSVGIPVKINTHSGLMHLKMSIIDGNTVTTGSYNYTAEATNENDEMFVIVTDPAFVSKCAAEFSRLWTGGGFVDAQLSEKRP